MRSGGSERDDGMLWDIACPARPSRVPGVTMAGFRDRGITPPGLRLIPHPAVTLVLVFGGTIAVEDATGRQHQGSVVTGLGFGESLRALRAEGFECLQVRLSPLAAHAVLGTAVADLDGAVVTLDDLWGREAARISEHLGELSCWQDRFALADAWLARRCAAAPQVAPEVAWAWRGIVAGRGLVAGQDAAGVAADGGYTDQSHLHRDVVAFTGLTPATVVTEPVSRGRQPRMGLARTPELSRSALAVSRELTRLNGQDR